MMTAPATERRFLKGAKAIAEYCEDDVRSTFRALEGGHVPGARKQGRLWIMDVRVYEASFRTSVAA
jgi:hypothetical protein